MSEDERMFQVKLESKKYKIHFGYDFFPEPDGRRFALCTIELEPHEFYSGIAVHRFKEPLDTKIGWKISLKRACEAMDWLFGEFYYKHFWHEIRLQLRKEYDAKMLAITEKILNENKIREESNGQNAS